MLKWDLWTTPHTTDYQLDTYLNAASNTVHQLNEHYQMSQDEIHYKLLKILEQQPNISQRALAQQLGISLGKANYCLKALMDKGLIKADNFKKNPDKRRYAYMLTPQGVKAKAHATLRFLKRKQAEYEALKSEISQLKLEAGVVDEL